MRCLVLGALVVSGLLASTPAAAQQWSPEVQGPPYVPPEPPTPATPGGFRMRVATGATIDVIYDSPIYQGGVEVALGGRFRGSDFVLYGHARYQGGQTDHGLTFHAPAAGMTLMYTPGHFRVGVMAETFLNDLHYFTRSGSELAFGGGAKGVIGAELVRQGDTAMFLEYRAGIAWSSLVESEPRALWSPGAIYLGARWGD